MAEENVTLQVNFEGISSLKTELKAANDEYQKLINSGKATADQIDAAARKVGAFKDQIKEANERAQALGSAEGRIRAIGEAARVGVSAFEGYKAILELTGQDTKRFEETMRQLQAVMALQQAIQGLEGAADAFKNMKTIGIDAFKALKVAIGSTGIGLLVVGLGLVVANFEDIKKAAIDMFPALENTGVLFDKIKQTVMGVGTAIKEYILTPFKFLGKLIQGDIDGALKELSKGLNVVKNYKDGANKEALKQEKDVQDKTAEIRAEAEAEQDKQNKAARAKIEAANKEKARLQREANDKAAAQRAELRKAEEEHLNRIFELNATEKQKEEAKVKEYYTNLINLYKKNKKDTTELEKDKTVELEKINIKYRQKEEEAQKEADQKKLKREEELTNRLKAVATKYIEGKIQDQLSIVNDEKTSFAERFAAMDEYDKLVKQKTYETEEEKNKAVKEALDKRKDLEQKYSDSVKAIEDKRRQNTFDAINASLQAAADITNSVMALSDQVTKNKLANVEKGSKEEEAILRKQFENQKKMQVAMALINGAQAVTAILSVPDFTLGVASAIRIAAAAVTTGLTVAKIMSTHFEPSSDAGKGSKFAKGGLLMGRKHAEGGIMTNFGELEGGEFVVNREATSSFLPMLEKINSLGSGSGTPNNLSSQSETSSMPMQQPIIKTYVVASDVTSQQEIQRKINNLARL